MEWLVPGRCRQSPVLHVRQVKTPLVDGLGQAHAVAELETEAEQWVRATKRGDDPFEKSRQLEGHAGADPKLAKLALIDVTHRRRQTLGVPQHARGDPVQLFTSGRQVDSPLAVDDQPGA